MDIFISCDAWWETGVDKIINLLPSRELKDFFFNKNYGKYLDGMQIILLCCNPLHFGNELEDKNIYSKNKKLLKIFFVLDFNLFMKIEQAEKNKIAFNKLVDEVPAIIKKCKVKDFNLEEFTKDWTSFLHTI